MEYFFIGVFLWLFFCLRSGHDLALFPPGYSSEHDCEKLRWEAQNTREATKVTSYKQRACRGRYRGAVRRRAGPCARSGSLPGRAPARGRASGANGPRGERASGANGRNKKNKNDVTRTRKRGHNPSPSCSSSQCCHDNYNASKPKWRQRCHGSYNSFMFPQAV